MRTSYDKILDIILNILENIDVKRSKKLVTNKGNKALYNYIIKEYINAEEYKELIASLKLKEENILNVLYVVISIFNTVNLDKRKNDTSVLNRSQYIINEASKYGFTWPDSNSCFDKVEEEFLELQIAIKEGNNDDIIEEMGDLIFTLQCLATLKDFDFTNILNSANKKFSLRFKKLKQIAKSEKIDLKKASYKTKERIWSKAKKQVISS